MDATQDNPTGDGRQRKFGLPNWMVNNIERLNFVTDIDQYACSPPETEGFLSDPLDQHDLSSPIESFCPVVEPSEYVESLPKAQFENKEVVDAKHPPDIFLNVDHSSQHFHSILNTLKHEELFSSPDSTPCATPEPSPAPRRKMSGQQDSVRSNPGRWFYLGNFQKPDQSLKGQCLKNSSKQKKIKNAEKANDIAVKSKDTSFQPKKEGIKLVISNFDINAISPSSW